MTQEVNHTAEAWLNVLRSKIDAQVRALLHPHHIAHEPGGKDAVRIPVIGLDDVVIASRPDNGDALTYVQGATELDDYWTAGPGGGGGGRGAAIGVQGAITTSTAPYGPTNLSGAAWTISRVHLKADAGVTAVVSAGGTTVDTLTVATGGGIDDNSGLSVTWSDGDSIGWALSSLEAGLSKVTLTVYAA